MNTALWITQALLGTMMLVLGFMKTFQPVQSLSKFSWTTRSTEDKIRFVGFSELLIGLGLILPQLTGFTPRLTSMAAVSLFIVMILAIDEHLKYNEKHEIGKNLVIMSLAAFVAVGRFIPFQ